MLRLPRYPVTLDSEPTRESWRVEPTIVPAATLVEVSGLIAPEMLVEIEAYAILAGG